MSSTVAKDETVAWPVIALALGDPAGVGPELVAKVLARGGRWAGANILVVGDRWLWERAQQIARVRVATRTVTSFAGAHVDSGPEQPAFLPMDTVGDEEVTLGEATASGGRSALRLLEACLDASVRGEVDAICFAPLNKQALKLAGMRHADELRHFAAYLSVGDYVCEFNVVGNLWTSRISSHVPIRDVVHYIDRGSIVDAASLLYRSLQRYGLADPRVGVAGLNPHNGEGGTCGREEIEIIEPAVRALNESGLPVVGPYAADTIFLRARNAELDGIVTMYHDQGQIAMKLLASGKGVTVMGGLPVPVTTPGHGTAYDIAGSGVAVPDALDNALTMASRMAASK